MPAVAIAPLARMAVSGVRLTGCTRATAAGKIPSSAHANIRRDVPSSMAGRSFISATAAPETITTVSGRGSSGASSPGAVRSLVRACSATHCHGTAWYTAAVKRK